MLYALDLLKQLADGPARQSEPSYEIVIHSSEKHDLEYSVMHINSGHVTNRRKRDGPSRVTLETFHKDPAPLKDHLGHLTHTPSGKILKSNAIYIRNEEGGSIDYLLSIDYSIAGLMTVDRSIKVLIDTKPQADMKQQPKQIIHNVNDLLDTLIERSVALIGRSAVLMNKEEEVTAIQFLNDVGASLITKSGDKVSKYFGISKLTLCSYIDVNSRRSGDKKA